MKMKLELTRSKATTEVQDQVKEDGIKEMFERMYQLDFNESSVKVHDVMTKKSEETKEFSYS